MVILVEVQGFAPQVRATPLMNRGLITSRKYSSSINKGGGSTNHRMDEAQRSFHCKFSETASSELGIMAGRFC